MIRCSTARDSALGDSGFGHWEGSNDQDTDYLPSQRTLVTGDQERSTVLHSLSEKDLKDSSEDSPGVNLQVFICSVRCLSHESVAFSVFRIYFVSHPISRSNFPMFPSVSILTMLTLYEITI